MLVKEINYKETSCFSPLFCDYINNEPKLKSFYNQYPSIDNFKNQIDQKKRNYKNQNREIIYKVIKEQYKGVNCSKDFKLILESIKNKNTFTITTGHQLNLFTGPIYFLYKIITTINLCEELSHKYPKFNFIPVYWMATEDHDFKEINHFNFKNTKIEWESNQTGVVGEFLTAELKTVLDELKRIFPNNKNSNELIDLFKNTYLKNNCLSDATRNFVHMLFRKYNLLIIDANHKDLKNCFKDFLKKEVKDSFIKKSSLPTINKLVKLNYKVQAHTRDVNLFYINNNQRQRILKNNNHLLIEGNKNKLDQKNIIKRIENNPEKFSPNVLFRTMYQEYLLPNLCYIGGPAEVSYWLQLKKSFEMLKITFPILLNRNSVLLISSRQMKKLKKLNIEIEDIFLDLNELTTKKTKEFSELNIDFSELKNVLKDQFKYLFDIASQTDHSFTGAVKAQEKKQMDGIIHLEKRLLSAQKKKFSDHLSRIIELKKELFPFETLQERRINFSEFYCEYGYNIIERLKKDINPLNMSFSVIVID